MGISRCRTRQVRAATGNPNEERRRRKDATLSGCGLARLERSSEVKERATLTWGRKGATLDALRKPGKVRSRSGSQRWEGSGQVAVAPPQASRRRREAILECCCQCLDWAGSKQFWRRTEYGLASFSSYYLMRQNGDPPRRRRNCKRRGYWKRGDREGKKHKASRRERERARNRGNETERELNKRRKEEREPIENSQRLINRFCTA